MGYSFNLDGSMMYCTFATLFIAQAHDNRLPWIGACRVRQRGQQPARYRLKPTPKMDSKPPARLGSDGRKK
jgi:hypothetical protein